MSKDHYRILGVAKTADDSQIKAAYRKLAREYHPDLHPDDPQAEERFKAINQAYETLRDPGKRAAYDQESGESAPGPTRPSKRPPHTGPKNTGGPQTAPGGPPSVGNFGNLDAMLGAMFGRPSSGSAQTTSRNTTGTAQGKTAATAAPTSSEKAPTPSENEIPIAVTLEEAFHGAQRTHAISVESPCPDCRGTGVSQVGRDGLQVGTICLTCRGARRKRGTEMVPVNIPRGIYDGAKLRLQGKGPVGRNGQRGDLLLTVHLKKHALFERDGSDLTCEVRVAYTVLVLGGEIAVPTLAGEQKMPIPAGTPSGRKLKLAGFGLPGLQNSQKTGRRPDGDLYVRVQVAIPNNVSGEERALLIELARLRNDPIRG